MRGGSRDGTRFAFGRNWRAFAARIDEAAIRQAEDSLVAMLGLPELRGLTFLDAGCGSGLFSLAARQLGARVTSFDVDRQAVRCTAELKRRHDAGGEPDEAGRQPKTDGGTGKKQSEAGWRVLHGSLLDEAFLARLGRFDVVYCWGVAHHTGAMCRALENLGRLLAPGGLLWVALYNDQGRASVRWRRVKRLYNRLPGPLRGVLLWAALLRVWGPQSLRDLLRGRPFQTWRTYAAGSRGMSPWHDLVDWVGGYPFEVARPEDVIALFEQRHMKLARIKTCGRGRGCNEYLFKAE